MFDAYRDWLEIVDGRRPPNLYQLLGLTPGKIDSKAVEAAASRQLAKLRPHLAGPHSQLASQLVDEIGLAKTTLLDPTRRAAYDSVFGFASRQPAPSKAPASPAPQSASPPAVAAPAPVAKVPLSAKAAPPTTAGDSWADAMASPPVSAPARAPAPAAKSRPPVTDALPPDPVGFEDEEPASGELPVVTEPIIRRRQQKSSSGLIYIGGSILALGLIGGIAFLVIKRGTTANEPEVSELDEDDAVGQYAKTTRPTREGPKKIAKKIPDPVETKERPKIVPKVVAADPPPKLDPAAEFREPKVFRGHAGTPRALAVSPDGKQFLTGGADGTVFSWTGSSEKPYRRKSLPAPAVAIGFLAEGKKAAVADPGNLYLVDLSTNAELRKLTPRAGTLTSLAVAADGQHLLTGSTDGTLRWWSLSGDAPESEMEVVSGTPIDCVTISPDGSMAASGNRADGSITLWDLGTKAKIKQWKAHAPDVTAVAFSPDGKRLVSTGADFLAKIWDLPSGALQLTLKGHDDVPLAAGFSGDGTMVITAGVDRSVRGWDAATGLLLRWGGQFDAKVFSLAVDPRDRFVIAGLNDGAVQMLFLPQVRPEMLPKGVSLPAPKIPLKPPPVDAVEAARKQIAERYASDFMQPAVADQLAFFDKLVRRARHSSEEPANRYALFSTASEVAAKSGRTADALHAIDQLARWFPIDELAARAQALTAAVGSGKDKTAVDLALTLVEEAEQQQRFDIVADILEQKNLLSESMAPPQRAARIQAARKRWADYLSQRDAIHNLQAEAARGADDPAFNTEYGKVLCFRQADWADGFKRLAGGEDPALKRLAKAELAAPTDAQAQAELSKAWFDYALAADAAIKPAAFSRCKFWCDTALANDLAPLEKLPLGQRIVEINKQLATIPKSAGVRPGETVLRRNFNTIRSEGAFASQWKTQEAVPLLPAEGVVLKNMASLTSRFKILDRCQVTFVLKPDGRSIKVAAAGQECELKATSEGSPITLTVERKADELAIQTLSPAGQTLEQKSLRLTSGKATPVQFTISASGNAGDMPMRLQSAVVNGPVILLD